MKKTLGTIWIYTIVILAAIVAACNKSSNAPAGTYYVSFNVNGVQKQFTVQTIAAFATLSSNYYYAAVTGSNTLIQGSPGLFININNPSPITTGINYTNADVTVLGNKDTAQAVLQYIDSTGTTYSSANFSSSGVTVSFSEIGNNIAKGIFSGTLQSATGGIPLSITDGRFVVKN